MLRRGPDLAIFDLMASSISRKRNARDWIVDSLVFVVGVVGALYLYDQGDNDGSSELLLAADFFAGGLLCLALWFRRRWPIQLAVAAAILTTFSEAAGAPGLLIMMTVAIYFRFRVTLALVGINLVSLAIYSQIRQQEEPVIAVLIAAAVVYFGTVGWGLYIRSRRQLLQTFKDRADPAETVARLKAEQAQLQAREEIAREMHDVLGHRLSLLSVHAGALAYRPDASTDEVAGAAEVIRASAHQACRTSAR